MSTTELKAAGYVEIRWFTGKGRARTYAAHLRQAHYQTHLLPAGDGWSVWARYSQE